MIISCRSSSWGGYYQKGHPVGAAGRYQGVEDA